MARAAALHCAAELNRAGAVKLELEAGVLGD
jgi:hypothetical protein